MDNNERATPPGLYDPIVTDQADGTQPNETRRSQVGVRDNGVVTGGDINAVQGYQNTQRQNLSGTAIAGPSTNSEAPPQYRRVYIGQHNWHTSPAAPSTSGEVRVYRILPMESYAASAPSLHPGSSTAPPASGQRPAYRPTANSNTIRPPPGLGHISGGNRSESARASHGTTEVPPGNGTFVSLMNRQSWGYDESTGPAEPQQDGQSARNSQERIRRATALDQRGSSAANSVQLINEAADRRTRRLEEYPAIARDIRRSFAEGRVDPRHTHNLRVALEFAEGVVAASARKSSLEDDGNAAEREFNANRTRVLEAMKESNVSQAQGTEDGAVRTYIAQLASRRARQRVQWERGFEYTNEQQRILREGQARRDAQSMDGWDLSMAGYAAPDRTQREVSERAASHREPSSTGSHTETQRYGSFDGLFFYDTDSEMPAYRADQPRPHHTYARYVIPLRGWNTYGGNNEASRAGEHPGLDDSGRSDHTYRTQTSVRGYNHDQHHDHSHAQADRDARRGQQVDLIPWNTTEWVERQTAQAQTNGVVLEARPSNEDNESLGGETPRHEDDEDDEDDEDWDDGVYEGLGAQGQDPEEIEYGEDWESVTFVGSDEEMNVEGGDDEPEDVKVRDEL